MVTIDKEPRKDNGLKRDMSINTVWGGAGMAKCCVCGKDIWQQEFVVPNEAFPEFVFCDRCDNAVRRLERNPSDEEYQETTVLFADFMRNKDIPAAVRDVYADADDVYWSRKERAGKYEDMYNAAIEELLLTTGSTFEGYKVVKYLNIISCEIIFKNSFLKSLTAGIEDFINALSFREKEMSGAMELIERAKEHVMLQFRKKAVAAGANAVLGIDFETSFGAEIVKISVNGTAVIVDKLE